MFEKNTALITTIVSILTLGITYAAYVFNKEQKEDKNNFKAFIMPSEFQLPKHLIESLDYQFKEEDDGIPPSIKAFRKSIEERFSPDDLKFIIDKLDESQSLPSKQWNLFNSSERTTLTKIRVKNETAEIIESPHLSFNDYFDGLAYILPTNEYSDMDFDAKDIKYVKFDKEIQLGRLTQKQQQTLYTWTNQRLYPLQEPQVVLGTKNAVGTVSIEKRVDPNKDENLYKVSGFKLVLIFMMGGIFVTLGDVLRILMKRKS